MSNDTKKERMARYDAVIKEMLNDPDRGPMDFYDLIECIVERAGLIEPKSDTIFDFLRKEGERQSAKSITVTIRFCPSCGSNDHLLVECGHEGCDADVCLREGCYSTHYELAHPQSPIVSLKIDAFEAGDRPPKTREYSIEECKDILRRMNGTPHGNPDFLPGLEASWAFKSAMGHLNESAIREQGLRDTLEAERR